MTRRSSITLFVLAAFLVVVAVASRALVRDAGVPEAEVRNRPAENPEDGYVSSDKCQSCHPGEYASWHASFHRSMTQVATPEAVQARFNITAGLGGESYRLFRKGREFWVELDDPDWTGLGTRQRVQRQVVMVTGSHQQQIYWMETPYDRGLRMLPFAWLIHDDRWAAVKDVFLQGTGMEELFRKGSWNTGCASCHATRPEPRVSDLGRAETQVAEFGISCEVCHGPGEEHVARHGNPLRRYIAHFSDEPDPMVVQPDRLSRQRATEVCGQCHSISIRDEEAIERWVKQGRTYQPGDDLSEHRYVVRDSDDDMLIGVNFPNFYLSSFWPDGMARVSGREYNSVTTSKCNENGGLSCLDCHSLHQEDDDPRPISEWRVHQLKPEMRTDAACQDCHGTYLEQGEAHTHHTPGSAGAECQNCHMPYTTYGLLKALRSHDITIPTVAETRDLGRPNACNLCHLDKSLGWTAEHLREWYGTAPGKLTTDQQTIAASVLWALTGDAGQRALAAWHMGWDPAREASDDRWLRPYLSHLLDDPYAAVRQIAYRSLKKLEGFEDFEYEYSFDAAPRDLERLRALELWESLSGAPDGSRGSGTLIDANGRLRKGVFEHLAKQRNERIISLLE